MKKYIFLAILLFIISGCGISTYQDVTIEDAKEMIANGEVEVVDVRTEGEFAEGHIPDATLMPLQSLEELKTLNKETSYLVVCRSGNRSSQASAILAENGFKEIYYMTGGMNEWDGEIQ